MPRHFMTEFQVSTSVVYSCRLVQMMAIHPYN